MKPIILNLNKMNIKEIRRENLRSLAKSVGGITALANKLGRAQSQISHLIGNKPLKNIGDRFAAEVERTLEKPEGWLDQQHFLTQEHSSIIQYQEIWLLTRNEVTKRNLNLPNLFALTIEDDSMQAHSGISFVKGGTVVVDRKAKLQNGSYVVISSGSDGKAMLRKFFQNDPAYLEALNPRYPRINLNRTFVVHGVVRQLIFDFLPSSI